MNRDSTQKITSFREKVRLILKNEIQSEEKRNIVIFALDGITHQVAKTSWKQAAINELISVFPTTSSTGWISNISGMSVDDHGIPGVVFKVHPNSNELINIFQCRNEALCAPLKENIFSDARHMGYTPLALLGDLEPFDCSWKDALLSNALHISSNTFYPYLNDEITQSSVEVFNKIEQEIFSALQTYQDQAPFLLWCFINVDHHIHKHGYDEHVHKLLEMIEGLAINLLTKKTIVIAHSDHGLIKTTHSKEIAAIFGHIEQHYQYQFGGAGRTRWVYAPPSASEKLFVQLEKLLPTSIEVAYASKYFDPNSLSGTRVGNIILVAKDEEFIMEDATCSYEHGSLTKDELSTPFALWVP